MTAVLFVCVALASLAAGVLAVAGWLWATRLQTSIPGPPTLPLLGNATMFYKMPVLLDRIAELHRCYGDIFRLYVGPKLIIVVTQPDDVQKLFANSKPGVREPYITYLLSTFQGNGLLVSKGEVWKNHRKFIEPAFHTEELEKFMDTFNEGGNFLCKKLAESNGVEIEITHSLIFFLARSTLATLFHTKLESLEPDLQKQAALAGLMAEFSKTFSQMLFRPWTTIRFFRWMSVEGRTLNRINKLAKFIVGGALDSIRKNLCNLDSNGRSIVTWLHPEKKLSFRLTEKEIYETGATLFSAGVETTADTMGYMLTLLGLHPEWQDKAQRELDDVFGKDGDYLRPVTTADFAQLPVIDAIVKETLRLFPTVPCIPYIMTEDTPLSGGRYVAPRGSSVLAACYLMHRNPKLFPDPHKFDPGRFLEGGSATSRVPYSYVPFGVGPRKCVGARYAVLQIKTVLATVLRRYRILPGSSRKDLEDSVLSLVIYPISGFRITCVPRDKVPLSST